MLAGTVFLTLAVDSLIINSAFTLILTTVS